MSLAPIIVFAYNRPLHLERTLGKLKKNHLASDSVLFVFSDGPRCDSDIGKVKAVRDILKNLNGFKSISVKERTSNLGLANSIIAGVTDVIDDYGKAIVMEDDLISSPASLAYLNRALDFYEQETKVFSITAYNHSHKLMKIPSSYKDEYYFSPRACSYAWATWRDRWQKADWDVNDYSDFSASRFLQKAFNAGGEDLSEMLKAQMDGEIDSWAIRWAYAHFKNNAYCLYPCKSYVYNIGFDGSGTHGKKIRSGDFKCTQLNTNIPVVLPPEVFVDANMLKNFKNVYKSSHWRSLRKFLGKFKKHFYEKKS